MSSAWLEPCLQINNKAHKLDVYRPVIFMSAQISMVIIVLSLASVIIYISGPALASDAEAHLEKRLSAGMLDPCIVIIPGVRIISPCFSTTTAEHRCGRKEYGIHMMPVLVIMGTISPVISAAVLEVCIHWPWTLLHWGLCASG